MVSLPSVPCSVHTISVEPKLQTFLLDYLRFCIGWGKFETFIFDKTSTIFCTKSQIFFGVDVILSTGAPFQQIDSAPRSQCTYKFSNLFCKQAWRLWGGKNQFMNHLVQVMPLDSLSPDKQQRPLLLAQSSGSSWDLLSSRHIPSRLPVSGPT